MNREELAAVLDRAVTDAFTLATSSHSRDPHAFGLSSLGRCRRAGAYALAQTPVSDTPPPGEGRAANLGTWEHAGLLPPLAKVLPPSDGEPEVERGVVLKAAGRLIPGHVDLYWGPVAVDLKTVGEHRLGRAQDGPFVDHRLQVGGYALALRQAGLVCDFLAWLYMDRASGNHRLHVEPFTTGLGLRVIERVAELVELGRTPDTAPRDGRGPGLDYGCDECPWLRRCWGDDAVPGKVGAQGSLLGRDADAVAAALDDYARAREEIRAAKERQEFARAVFTGAPSGTYGRWRWYTNRDSYEIDVAAAAQLLRDMGVDPPERPKTGALQVRPA